MKERWFYIRFRDEDGLVKTVLVEGEFAFEFKGFRFFVRRGTDRWIVSDCLCGCAISWHENKGKAIYEAAGKILLEFDHYLSKCKNTKLGRESTKALKL